MPLRLVSLALLAAFILSVGISSDTASALPPKNGDLTAPRSF
jgi:hypothetical protein